MPLDDWSIFNFSQSNPSGPGKGSVSALLRRVADTLDGMGLVEVQDLVFKSVVDSDGDDDLTITVYYHRPASQDGQGEPLSR